MESAEQQPDIASGPNAAADVRDALNVIRDRIENQEVDCITRHAGTA
jgi:hypothetical protein